MNITTQPINGSPFRPMNASRHAHSRNQCGFVRISSNPRIIANGVTPDNAITVLQRMTSHANHVFWEDTIALSDPSVFPRGRIRGHQQVTDAYLFALALKHGGQLATFDEAVATLAASEQERSAIVVIPR